MPREATVATVYLLGEGWILGPDGERLSPYPDRVHYTPGCEGGDFYLGDGEAHVGGGTFLSAAQALQPQWRRHLEIAGVLWLVPVLERMAQGQEVAQSEVFEAYKKAHGARPRREEWPMFTSR